MVVAGPKSRLMSRLVSGLELVLFSAICFVVVRAGLTFFAPQSVWITPRETPLRPVTYSSALAPSFNASFDAFHPEQSGDTYAQEPAEDIGADAPETSLNLKLIGMRFDSSDAELGGAILQTPDNAQSAYYVGDEIIRGVTLNSVSKDFVTLSLEGRLERLSFEGAGAGLITRIATQEAASDEPSKELLSSPARASALNQTGTDMSMQEFLASHKLTPVLSSGKVQGYEIIQTQAGFDLTKFGLESGDVINRIGDTDLTKGQVQWARVLENLTSGRVSSVSLLRDGKAMTVKVDP